MTLQPEGAYYWSLGHGTTKEHDYCHQKAHRITVTGHTSLQPTMPNIDIQSQPQSVHCFHYLVAILLFASLMMDRLTGKVNLLVLGRSS